MSEELIKRLFAQAADARESRPAPAVHVPEVTDAVCCAGFEALRRRGFRVNASDMSCDDLAAVFKAMYDAAAPAPATVATEATGKPALQVDAEKVMALVEEYGRNCTEFGCYGPALENIRALLTAAPAWAGGYVSAGVVINNNQPGSQYIVEAHHGQTVCVGTEVFIK